MALDIPRTLEEEIGDLLDSGLQADHPAEPMKDSLATFRFPYCGLRHLYEKLTVTEWKRGFGMEYYTGNGISMHIALQKAMGLTGKVIGDWHCTKVTEWDKYTREDGSIGYKPKSTCKGTRKFSTNSECPLCKSKMTYDELGFKNKRHLIGKMDGLFALKKPTVIDYKSSSVKAIENGRRYQGLPYVNNVAQIKAYVVLGEQTLQEQGHDIELSDWALLYLARDNPLVNREICTGTVTRKEKRKLRELYDVYDDQYHTVMFMQRLREARFLIETKPCKNECEYKEKFGKFASCPMAEDGVCWNTEKIERKLKRAWGERKPDWQLVGRPKYLDRFKE